MRMEIKRKKLIIIISLSLVVIASVIIPVILIIANSSFNTAELGQINIGGEAFDVDIEGNLAFVVNTSDDGSGGLVIINISDPTHPIIVGSYHQSNSAFSVEVVGEFAYLANPNVGLEVLNVSDPTNPVKIEQYTGSGEIYDVQVIGEIAYITDWSNGLILLNISDPLHVSVISSYNTPGACLHVHVDNGIACIIDHYSSYSALRLVNVSNPQSLVPLSYHAPANVDFWNPFIYQNKIYTANHGTNGGDLRIFDISDPSVISPISTYDDGGFINSYFIESNLVYMADYENGLKVIDTTDITNPRLIARYFDGGHSIEVVVVGDIAYVADHADGLEIIKIQNL